MNEPITLFDRSLKVRIRHAAPTLFRLAGVTADPLVIQPTDTAINISEFRADQVFLVRDAEDPLRWAIHIEYQMEPDARVLEDWFFKNAALTVQLQRKVILLVVYLTRGRRASFPDTYTVQGDGLTNSFRFETIRLWEHADRIRSGELVELAPLLVLCENRPTEATLRKERELILRVPVPELRRELLAVALTVATRYFSRDLLLAHFREELDMLKEASIIQEWIDEGEARGEERGRTAGVSASCRPLSLRVSKR